MATQLDMPLELWGIANNITSFAVAQGIAFCYALSVDLSKMQSWRPQIKLMLITVFAICAGIYSFAVYKCWRLIDPSGSDIIWCQVTFGRYMAIWLFTVLIPTFGLFAHSLFNRKEVKPSHARVPDP